MSCCGNRRRNWSSEMAQPIAGQVSNNITRKMWQDAVFEYIGDGEIVITGNITGQRYRFSRKGEKSVVDYRDASAMSGIGILKKVTAAPE